MGHRVHVCKTYKVEYGDTSDFNWNNDCFYKLLQALGGEPDDCGTDQGCYSDTFECPTGDYDDAVLNLKAYIKDPTTFEDNDDIRDNLDELYDQLSMTPEEVLDTMQRFRNEADTHDGYLHFSAF